jgi:glycosyltransferase involved in cell wall biosynthesis
VSLGVYVVTLNEENLIEDTLKHVVKVFPQVEVIDLGSNDRTLKCLDRFDIPINQHVLPVKRYKHDPINPSTAYTIIKNQYADKHDWVFFIDGDEIFNEENLLKLKAKVDDGKYTAYRVGWKNIREHGTRIQVSNMIVNGCKLYKTSDYKFHRGWPREVLRPMSEEDTKQPKEECDIWCWHGVLLQRSNSIPEKRGREKKRNSKAALYEASLTWKDTNKWPWM